MASAGSSCVTPFRISLKAFCGWKTKTALALLVLLGIIINWSFFTEGITNNGVLLEQAQTMLQESYQTRTQQPSVSQEPQKMQAIPARVRSVSCDLLIQGNPTERTKAEQVQKAQKRPVKSLTQYILETHSCEKYQHGGFATLADVDEEELHFPLAFSLLIYRDIEQVERLLRAVYRPHNLYCVHVDKKCDETYRAKMALIARCLPNVFLSNVSVDVQWGRFTNLEPEVLCMRQLWDRNKKWKYFINLTGQEFPLKTNREMVRILTAFRGANDISGTTKDNRERYVRFLPAPFNVTVYKGAVHILASRGYVDYLLHSRVGRQLYEWVKQTAHPDELYFNTLNHNIQLGVPGALSIKHTEYIFESFSRYKIWQGVGSVCAGKYVRLVCHLGVGDLPRLATSPYLIANKFTYDYHPLAYDCVEQWYFHKRLLEENGTATPINVSMYEKSQLVQNSYRGHVKLW